MNCFEIEVFYDGDCPLCMREINFLKRRDKRDAILFTDISTASFDASDVGKSYQEMMERIHGRLPDGTWVEGVDVFRRLYAAIGWRKIVRLTRLPLVSHVLNAAYYLFAKNRLRVTGRCIDERCDIGTLEPSVKKY